MIFITLIFSANSCLFLNVSPDVLSQGLGGIESVVCEGFACYNNPSLIYGRSFNFTFARYLYGLNLLSLGGNYKRYSGVISYLNYGEIQSYDEFGQPRNSFSPSDLIIAGSLDLDNFGFSIKAFQERIDSLLLIGICFGVGSHIELGRFLIGSKIDNIGKEFRHNAGLPFVVANGMRYKITDSLEIFLEVKTPDLRFHTGLLYLYQNAKIFAGGRYMIYKMGGANLYDIGLTGGIKIKIEEYEIGYSFLYTQFSTAHLFSIDLHIGD